MTKTFDTTPTLIYARPEHAFEAFMDIKNCFKGCMFENIKFDAEEGVLEYDVFDKHIIKPFDMTQATPEIAADMIQWLFSMLDAMANF